MPPQAQFTRRLVRTVNRLMIESTCMRCGATGLVSEHDGTLENWEEGHNCSDDNSDAPVKPKPKEDNGS